MPLTVPPESTNTAAPVPLATAPLASAPDSTVCSPPLLIVVDRAVPPPSTNSESPLLSTSPLLVSPLCTT